MSAERETKPVRIQLSREKGWKMPENTVKVDRSTKWGNPYRVGDPSPKHRDVHPTVLLDQDGAVEAFNDAFSLYGTAYNTLPVDDIRRELAGKNLACWCPLGQPCHADVLLEIANQKEPT